MRASRVSRLQGSRLCGFGADRTLFLCSAVCCLWVGLRILQTGQTHYRLLWWNLFLAWVPLGFARAMELAGQIRSSAVRWACTGATGVLWLLFFPNAPYLFTDLIHAHRAPAGQYWVDFSLILGCAVAGWMAGLASLRVMHARVASWWGSVAGWSFCSLAWLAAGVGVYLGRVLRLHSWDVLLHPPGFWQGLSQWILQMGRNPEAAGFPLGFAAVVGISYVLVHGLAQAVFVERPTCSENAPTAGKATLGGGRTSSEMVAAVNRLPADMRGENPVRGS
ncbi:MAG: DUF1361 domain-containing protein [Limisphaera sp.]|nr:DUF1361 domain-containing protein [Limisphaera sp.]